MIWEESGPLRQFELHRVGFLLAALPFENLLKGVWAGRNKGRVKNIKSIGKQLRELKRHDLVYIAKEAKVALTDDEKGLLADLSKIIAWYGRYPVPLNVQQFAEHWEKGVPLSRFYKGSMLQYRIALAPGDEPAFRPCRGRVQDPSATVEGRRPRARAGRVSVSFRWR